MKNASIRKKTSTLKRGFAMKPLATGEEEADVSNEKTENQVLELTTKESKTNVDPADNKVIINENKEHKWEKNIESGISNILKKLDQIAISRVVAHSQINSPATSAITGPAGTADLKLKKSLPSIRYPERNQLIKERDRLLLRNEHLERINDQLSEENRLLKARYDEIINYHNNRQILKKTPKISIDDNKAPDKGDLTENGWKQHGEQAGWLSLWNILPHMSPISNIPAIGADSNFQQQTSLVLLRCLQINLQHKKKAMERTKRLIIDRNIDIVLIQEPYAVGHPNPELYGVPVGYTGFHILSENHPYGAAIIAKNSLRAKTCPYAKNEIIGVQVRYGNKTYHFYSVFCRPSALTLSAILTPLLDQAPSTLVIGMDASAKHPKWNKGMIYRKIDQRGKELERLLDQYELHLANQPLYKLNYVPDNYSYIDVTLGGENVRFHDWKFWEDSLSDHPYIFCQVE